MSIKNEENNGDTLVVISNQIIKGMRVWSRRDRRCRCVVGGQRSLVAPPVLSAGGLAGDTLAEDDASDV